jgi:hypothetical protein
VSILIGTGTGSFVTTTSFSVGPNAYSIVGDDFDGDGKIDLAIANSGSANVSVFLGNNTGGFGLSTNFTTSGGPSSIISADFNGDGRVDLATANSDSSNISILLNCFGAGLTNFNDQQLISIYPNPTSDQFFIETNTTDKLTLDLYDVNGRHVFNANIIDKSNVDVTSLNDGVYSVTIKTASGIINKKLVILR